MRPAGDKPGEVRHVHQVDRAHLVGNLPHAREIDESGIGAAAANDELRPLALGDALQIVVVDGLGFLGYAVGNDLVGLAGKVQRMSVTEVTAVREIQAEYRVSRLDDRGIGGHVGGRSRMWLHVGVLRPKQLLGAIARQVLDHIGEFASAVIALAGIAFGVLVGEDRACRFKHGFAHKVFRGDQLQAFVLAPLFVFDRQRNVRINFRQRSLHRIYVHDSVLPAPAVSRFRYRSTCHACAGFPSSSRSMAAIFSTRRSWRPPANGVASHLSTIWKASSSLMVSAPSASTLASLCSRDRPASNSVSTLAARMPGTLLAAIDMPIPVLHTRIPRSAPCAATSSPTARAKSG